MRTLFLIPSLLLAGCAVGVNVTELAAVDQTESAAGNPCVDRITGSIEAMGEPLAGAVVLAVDAQGKRLGKALTGADGTYFLKSCGVPAQMRVKAPHRVPRSYPNPLLLEGGPHEWEFNTDVGPYLGADGTGRLLTYMVRATSSSVEVVPHVAWGGSGIGSPFEEVWDLMQGSRVPQLLSLVPAGTRPAPSLEDSVQVVNGPGGPILELSLSKEANGAQLGSAFEAAYIRQLVDTTCINASPDERLPVRIRVQCASCPGGWTALKDGHLGPDGPMDAYTCQGQAPGEAFPDVAEHRYAREIAMAKGMKLAWSVGNGTFQPDAPVTRADLTTWLVTALGMKPEQPCTPSFGDVPSNAWYCGYVETAAAKGLASADAQGKFRPAGAVTRAELAAYVARAARWPSYAPMVGTFTDVPPSYWAFARIETAHAWCHAVEARQPGTLKFEPAEKATRAEALSGVVRMLECLTGDEVGP